MLNVISVDVEEYFHATNISSVVGPPEAHNLPSRLEPTLQRLLELLSRNAVKGTFFFLGPIADRFPHLVKEVAAQEHKITSHNYQHHLTYKQTPKKFLPFNVKGT